MITFKTFFSENMTSSGTLGCSSTNVTQLNNADWFAPGDARIPKGSKLFTRAGIIKKRRKYKK